jgi:exodeoxyribonuclease VII large subunit
MSGTSGRPIRSVTEINADIRLLLDSEFRFIRVRGEVSNIRQPYSGHTYFVLKDERSQLNSVIFKNQQRWLHQPLKDGQQVVCDGRISVYEPRGQYQLIVDTVDFDGTGQLRILFEQLKEQLRSEGLFEPERKSPLPRIVDRIALITSPSGAAVHDFLSVCRKRSSDALIQIVPVRVQGDGAAEQICRALETAGTLSPDVIVLCRGGGSIEDLWAFNEESVARAIVQSAIPVVTGIGHETDFTIADFCADVRCPTPTAAAQLVTADPSAYLEKLSYLAARLKRALVGRLDLYQDRLDRSAETLSTFDKAFSHHTFTVDHCFSRLCGAMALGIERQAAQYAELRSRLHHSSPASTIQLYQHKIDYLSEKCLDRGSQAVEAKENRLIRNSARLDALSPLKTMARGYSIVTLKGRVAEPARRIVTASDQVGLRDEIEIRLHQGELDCQVVRKRP